MLHKYNIPPQASTDILNTVFGKNYGSTHMEEGLPIDIADFNKKMDRSLD